MPRIVRRERLVPNIHLLEVYAPEVARTCRPGQFVIVMTDARGERIPLTIADWDRGRGTVTTVIQATGTTTRKLAVLEAGGELAVFSGPLGLPSETGLFGTVLLAGGCFGMAALFPVARALKESGNRVIFFADVKAGYLLYWEERLRKVSDVFLIGSRDDAPDGEDVIAGRVRESVSGGKVDRVHAVGCTHFMFRVAEATRAACVPTVVSLNPVMVDGTGMCGACRVTVGGATKFACVDGPDFDGHLVDWGELFARRASYIDDEIRSLCRWERETYD